MKTGNSVAVIVLLLLLGCEVDNDTQQAVVVPGGPTGPGSVLIVPSTVCGPTGTAGELRITDSSGPADIIAVVFGDLYDSSAIRRCQWSIDRAGVVEASAVCRGLTPGTFTFSGWIRRNDGGGDVRTDGGCTLPTNLSSQE